MEKNVNSKGQIRIKTAVDVVIFNERNQILLGKRLVKVGFGQWGYVGGHLRVGETILDCGHREIEEEIGKDVVIELNGEIVAVRENSLLPYFEHHITVLIRGFYVSGEIKVNEPTRCKKWEWFDIGNLPKDLFSGVRETLYNHKKGKVLVISDWQNR